MIGEPGSKLDFSTFISYILPGYILEYCFYAILDIVNIYFHANKPLTSMFPQPGVAVATFTVAASLLLAYFLGLVLDFWAHTEKNLGRLEQNKKTEAYESVLGSLKHLVDQQKLEGLFGKTAEGSADDAAKAGDKVKKFIDAMFYRLATEEIWARQNWSWAFYESSRQLCLLVFPLFILGAYHVSLLLVYFFSGGAKTPIRYLVPSAVAVLSGLFARRVRRHIKEERDIVCRAYYEHRAYVVFAYLIQLGLSKGPAAAEAEKV